jgi:hypothetical protein
MLIFQGEIGEKTRKDIVVEFGNAAKNPLFPTLIADFFRPSAELV